MVEQDILTFSADELSISDATAKFLAATVPLDRLHRPNEEDIAEQAREKFGKHGWFALAVPESRGGSGLSAVEHALFFRQVGRCCGPLDILAQTLACLAVAQDEKWREALLAPLLEGHQGVALAVMDGSGLRVLGRPNAPMALWVEPNRASLFDISSLQLQTRPMLDPGTSMRWGVETAPRAIATVDGPFVWQMGQLAVAAMLVGLAETALQLIVDYAKVRETFGRKIGAYQAVRHPCADMVLRLEAARAQLWYAAASMRTGAPDVSTHSDAAKYLANEAAIANADTNIQLHGGIGVTDEHHAHLLLKRALLLTRLFGTRRALLSRLLTAKLQD